MTGTYILPAIPPHCSEIRTKVAVEKWLGDRVLLRDLEMEAKGVSYLIETTFDSFIPDIPNN